MQLLKSADQVDRFLADPGARRRHCEVHEDGVLKTRRTSVPLECEWWSVTRPHLKAYGPDIRWTNDPNGAAETVGF